MFVHSLVSVNTQLQMGNHASHQSHTCSLSPLDMKVLGEHTHLTTEQIKENFIKFQEASRGGDTITRRKFSGIMHKCFPRTHKVTGIVSAPRFVGTLVFVARDKTWQHLGCGKTQVSGNT